MKMEKTVLCSICMVHLFNLPFAKHSCNTALTAVEESVTVLSTEGKDNLKHNVKEIANSVLSATDPNIGLDTEEAQKCIEETASSCREPTVAGRLKDAFPIANRTGEVEVENDPSQPKIHEGPQHELFAASMMDEVMTQFDPRDKANIAWNASQDPIDYDAKVIVNFRQLERNWSELKDNDLDLRRITNNPVSELITHSGGSEESLNRLGRTDDTQN